MERVASGAEAEPSGGRKPVWDDPDDENLRVDISKVSRLRKLRATEEDTVISGMLYLPVLLATDPCRICGDRASLPYLLGDSNGASQAF